MTRRKRGTAPAIAALILFGILFSVGTTYFLTTIAQERTYEQAQLQHIRSQSQAQQVSGNVLVYGSLVSGQLSFFVNNTGPGAYVVAYWILNGSNAKVMQYENKTTLPRTLPYYIPQGQSAVFSNTNITFTSITQTFIIRVTMNSGQTVVGTYPSAYSSTSSLNSQIASGLG